MWQGRLTVQVMEAEVQVPGRAEPVAVLRRVRTREGVDVWRAVTWASTSRGRTLIGRWPDIDGAAVGAWRAYVDAQTARHEAASTTHGGHERDGLGKL